MNNNNENKLVPKLRFPEFKDVWKTERLSNLLDYERPDNYIVKDTNYISEGTPVLTANKSFILGYTQETFGICTNIPAIIFDDFTVDKKFVDFPFKVKSSAIKILRPKGTDDLKFIFELMSLIRFEAKDHKRYYISAYQNLSVLIPKPSEQNKIAACLRSLDLIIKAESQKLDLLYKYKKGLLQNLFPKEGETVPKFRFKQFTKSWKKVKLRDVSLYFNGGSFENDVKEEGKYELITLKSINTNGQLVSSKRFVDIEVPTLAKDTLVMILSEQAPGLLGMTAIIPTANKYVLNQRVAEIRPSQEVDSYFLSMAINRNQAYFSKQGAGMKVQNISKPNVQNYEFLIPEIQEQKKIAFCLSSLDEIISAQNQTLNSLQYHKKGLLQGLFPNVNDGDNG
jgi:type I restriction enzyme S subunit